MGAVIVFIFFSFFLWIVFNIFVVGFTEDWREDISKQPTLWQMHNQYRAGFYYTPSQISFLYAARIVCFPYFFYRHFSLWEKGFQERYSQFLTPSELKKKKNSSYIPDEEDYFNHEEIF
jgi:hypothetical protein